jgi:amino acid adenylation domain-containing protein
LYNYTLPILRYELGDYVTRGGKTELPAPSSIRAIRPGKANDALPVLLDIGTQDTISPRALTSFYAPGIERVQFISLQEDRVRIDYVARRSIDTEVRNEFQRILNMKGASRMSFEVRRVPGIPADRKTGKVRLVVRNGGQAEQPSTVVVIEPPSDRCQLRDSSPESGFVAFNKREIEQSISHRFEQQVETFSEHPAIRSSGFSFKYNELNRAANRIAHAILARPSQPHEPIAVLLEQGIMAVVTILGILKTGNFYVALDPSYPQPWLTTILADSRASLLVTDHANLPLSLMLVRRPEQILNIDDLDAGLPDHNPALSIAPDSLAYLFYTSGSTGRPKGVMQTHRNVLHQIASYTNRLKLSADDSCTLLHSHCFSASRLDIFGALLNGGELLPFPVGKEGIAKLASWLLEEQVTVFHWFPTGFRRFIDSLKGTNQFPNVRVVVLGSEPVSLRDVANYKRHFAPGCILVNRFGTTETGNISWFFIRKDTYLPDSTVPVGYAIEDTEVLLLDEEGKEVGYDQPGEIVVKSRYLSPGYWLSKNPIAAKLMTGPTPLVKRTYRTGDLGCKRPDGCLIHLGRKDLQAKIRGYRIEVGQIESALLDHPAVREVVVVAREEMPEGRRLVAYIVTAGVTLLTSTALRNFLEARIPAHMVPSDFVQLESLPVTPSGKLNRRALPDPAAARLGADAPLTEPSSVIEKTVAEIWRNALGISRVGLHTTFFDLGGHSLIASAILFQIADKFKIEISFRQFFEQPTVAQMAEIVSRNLEKTAEHAQLASVLSDVESLSDEEARQVFDDESK